jgi:superfamily II DNA or RNA helicase
MIIEISDKLIKIADYPYQLVTLLKEYFVFDDYSYVYVGGKYDESKKIKRPFFGIKNNIILIKSGLFKSLITLIKNNNIKIDTLVDNRTRFPFQKDKSIEVKSYFPSNFNYTEHQELALKAIIPISRGIVQLPTSAGKGDILAIYVKIVNLPTLILVNKKTLASQLYARIKDYGIKSVGLWSSDRKENGNVVVALIGSVKSIPDLEKFKVLIADEVHNTSALQFQDFFDRNVYPIQIGFSATPNKGDKYKFALVRQHFGEILTEVKVDTLIDNKVIVKPIINFINNVCKSNYDWQSTYLTEIIENVDRNNKIVEIYSTFKRQTLILITDVKNGQGEWLKERLEECGASVEFLYGSISTKKRSEIIDSFEEGKIDVIIATTIFDEGVSVKSIKVFINASGGKSKVKALQRLGRSLRIKDGKEKVLVFDFADSGNVYTERHSNMRKNHYKKAGFTDINYINIEDTRLVD